MKVSVLTLLTTAMLATARVVPPCDHGTADVAEHDLTIVTSTVPCLRVCWAGYFPKQFGNCWTCCRNLLSPQGFELEEEEFESVHEMD
jgi:hypothetical protein